MPRTLAHRLNAIAPSATLAMNARALDLKAKGVDVFAFGVGEPDFDPPAHVLEAAKRAIDAGASKYTAVSGIPALKKAICDATERSRGYAPSTDEVCVSVGAKHALFNIAVALFEPGDEVLIPAPYWVSYPEQVKMMGAEPVIIETSEEDGWRVSPEALRSALSPKTKAFILCSPSNPTGSAYTEDQTRALLEVLREHDCWLIADEIYGDLVYDGFRHASAAKIARDMRDRMILVDGVSKTYAMTGWRVGWSIAPRHVTKAIETVQGQSTTNATAVAQHAAVAALTGPQDALATMRTTFERRRNCMVQGLSSIPGIRCRTPEGAFYAFADVRGLYGIPWNGKPLSNDEEVAFWMLDTCHVAAVPGSAFGAPGYMRFSYAVGEERINGAVAALRHAVEDGRRAG